MLSAYKCTKPDIFPNIVGYILEYDVRNVYLFEQL